jgi:hypothetical protein
MSYYHNLLINLYLLLTINLKAILLFLYHLYFFLTKYKYGLLMADYHLYNVQIYHHILLL